MPRKPSAESARVREAVLADPQAGNKQLAEQLGVDVSKVNQAKQALKKQGLLKGGRRRKRAAAASQQNGRPVEPPGRRAESAPAADPFAVLDEVYALVDRVGAHRLLALVQRIVEREGKR